MTENDSRNHRFHSGHTDLKLDDKTGAIESFTITLDPTKMTGNEDYAIDAAHEGTHITNYSDPRFAAGEGAGGLSDFSDEYRAYQTSVWAASALGSTSYSFGKGQYPIWNKSWGAIDDKVLTKYITDTYLYSSGKHYKETTPHNPWPD